MPLTPCKAKRQTHQDLDVVALLWGRNEGFLPPLRPGFPPLMATVLATGGDLVFVGGTNDRMFRAEAAAQSGARVVARDEIDGSVVISTIFTGLDLETDADAPRLFETMMFLQGKSSGVAIRSETWQQAESQHRRMARQVREADAEAAD